MQFEATVRINAPILLVWNCMLDLPLVGSCVGDGVEISGETLVGGKISAVMGVGFSGQRVSAKADITWLVIEPAQRMSLLADIWVTEKTPVPVQNKILLVENDQQTVLQWWADVELDGKLRGVPPTLVRSFVAQQSRAFFVCFKGKVEGLAELA
jgi:carbon monoxide dehydrogenase subunit G